MELGKYLQDRDIHGFEELVNSGLSQLCHACIQHSSPLCVRRPQAESSGHSHLWLETIRASGTILWYRSGETPKCVPHVGACASQLVLWYPGQIRNTNVSRNRVENSDVSLASQCPRVFLLSFHYLLIPAEERQLPWCDVETCDGSVSTRHEQIYGTVYIRVTNARGMAGHAAQLHMFLHCSENSQSVNTMISSFIS